MKTGCGRISQLPPRAKNGMNWIIPLQADKGRSTQGFINLICPSMAATWRMIAQAADMGADAIINTRYMTTSVVGSAAELLVYGTAVKLGESAA